MQKLATRYPPDSASDFRFVAVHIGSVNEADSVFQRRIHSVEAGLTMEGIGADAGGREFKSIVHCDNRGQMGLSALDGDWRKGCCIFWNDGRPG